MSDVTAQVRYINDEWKERVDRAFIYSKETRRANTTLREVQIYDARPCMQRVSLTWTLTGLYSLNATLVLATFTMMKRFVHATTRRLSRCSNR